MRRTLNDPSPEPEENPLVEPTTKLPEKILARFLEDFNWDCRKEDCDCKGVVAYKAGWEGLVPVAAYNEAYAKDKAVPGGPASN